MVMKVLLLSHSSDLNGAERCLVDLVAHLDRSRFEPLVLLPSSGPIEKELRKSGVRYLVRYNFSCWIPYRDQWGRGQLVRWFATLRTRLWALQALVEKEKIDLIYTNTSILIEGALVARRLKIPHVWHIHEFLRNNLDIRTYLPHFIIDRLVIFLSDRIVTPSKYIAEQRFNASSKVRVAYNGVDLRDFSRGNGGEARENLGIKKHVPIVTFVGAIDERKDPITFVQAADLVLKDIPDVCFLLVGDLKNKILVEKIETLISNYNLKDRIRLLGTRRDVADILTAASVHVSSSRSEVQPISVIEAMAAGRPVITTDWPGAHELVVNEKTGIVVKKKNYEELANALKLLLRDKKMCEQFGQAGLERAKNEFSAEAYTRRIEKILDEVVSD